MPLQPADPAQRAKIRTLLIVAGLFEMALAGFFLGWGASVLGIEPRVAWLIAAVLAAGGVSIFFVATLAYGRRGAERTLDGDDEEDEPVIRR